MLIKALLLTAIAVLAITMLRAGTGARPEAIRRLGVLALALVAAFTVIYPGTMTTIATALGVGRGTDLLLYLFIITFFGYMLTASRRRADLQRQVTLLARQLTLQNAPDKRATNPETE